MFKNIDHQVLYTDASFKKHGDRNGHILGQVPFHSSRRYYLNFILGLIPEWRGRYSHKWLHANLEYQYSSVYAFVYSVNCIKFADWVAYTLGIPIFIHVADHSKDFESREINKILRQCTKLICITKKMQKHYEIMLGRKNIEVLHNGAEECCFNIPDPRLEPFSDKNPFKFCFLGGLFSHLHGDCIEDFFEAIKEVRKKYQWVKFNLFGQKQPSNFLKDFLCQDGVLHHGVVLPLDNKFKIMEDAHCFVIPSSFNPYNHEDYKFSFPTKLPELIACGRPILSYGPADTSANRLLEQYKIGIRIHHRSVDNLIESILFIVENYSHKLNLAKSTRKIAITDLSAHQVRSRLSQIIAI
jgi:glycosyltransferase involved in cell wall biosynthesis